MLKVSNKYNESEFISFIIYIYKSYSFISCVYTCVSNDTYKGFALKIKIEIKA